MMSMIAILLMSGLVTVIAVIDLAGRCASPGALRVADPSADAAGRERLAS